MIRNSLRVFIYMLLVAGSYARPLHRYLPSESNPNPSLQACTFPDGTNPSRGPGVHCYTPAQFVHAYGIDKIHDAKVTGAGQTIILADSFGSPTIQQDLDYFSEKFGLPKTTIEFIYPNGPYINPLENADQLGWAQETTLDLEWAHVVAPGAKLVNIVTNNSESTAVTGFPDLFKGLAMAAKLYPHSIISMSFGTGEATFTNDEIKTYVQGSFHHILRSATHADMTLLAGAGDAGSTNINTEQTSLYGFPNAFYPASDPLITAVGGTALQSDWLWDPQGTADDYWNCRLQNTFPCPTDFLHFIQSTGTILESVWKEDWALAGGGGGVSTVFAAPKFQENLGDNVRAIAKGQRAIPDVAMNAAINGGVAVYTSFAAPALGVAKPAWQVFGGTSCATPEMAGMIALAGQVASSILRRPVGIGALNPLLYRMRQRAFNDIVSQSIGPDKQVAIDNNALYFSEPLLAAKGPTRVPPVAVPGYFTMPGYDLATGLGSPRGEAFVLELARARVAEATR